MTFPTKEDEILLSGLRLLTCHPMAKSSSCNFKNTLKGYVSAKTGYRLPNVHTLHNQVRGWSHGRCIFCVKRSHFSSSSFLCGSYPSEKWLRKFNKSVSFLGTYDARIGHNKDDVIVPLYAVYTHQRMFKKSFEFGYDYDDADENGKYTWRFYMTLIYFSFTLNAILCNCNVALWRKKFCLSNPTVQTPTVNYGQFSFFRGKPSLSVQSPAFVSKAVCSMLDSSS